MSQKMKLALLCAAVLCGISCDLPEGPNAGRETGSDAGVGTEAGTVAEIRPGTGTETGKETGPETPADTGVETGTLILRLPGTKAPAGKADASRAVISNAFIDTLYYRITLTHTDGGVVSLETGGGETAVSLKVGDWTIDVSAYNSGGTAVGSSGSVPVTIVAGQSASPKISMTVDPDYEADLTEIYIHNEAELRRVAAGDFAIDGTVTHFYLENDIVLEEPWTPIGGPGNPFKAEFDGQDHSITVNSFAGAVVDVAGIYLGVFAYVDDAAIKNVTIKYELAGTPVDITSGISGSTFAYAGGVAGYAQNTAFEEIGVTGNFQIVSNDASVVLKAGGIAGYSYSDGAGGTITGSHVRGLVGGEAYNVSVGGIAGGAKYYDGAGGGVRIISESSFTGTVSGVSGNSCQAGGIVGLAENIEIIECFAEGRVAALDGGTQTDAGGIVGYADNYWAFNIKESYVTGVIESATTGFYANAGGIIASFSGPTTIENCYAWANISTSSTYGETAGGIAGTSNGTISKCYAAGTIQSKGHNPYTVVGGIAGDSSGSGTISACMALVSELDGGPSTSVSRTANAIFASLYGTLSDNYALPVSGISGSGVMWIYNNTNASDQGPPTAQDGEARSLADFTSQTLYDAANWDFTNVWKFISGWDYPVLNWQDAAPGAGMEAAAVAVEIGWL